jgi:DNA polymerase
MRDRGRLLTRYSGASEPAARRTTWWLVTVHPSAVLRADDETAAYGALVADLRVVAAALSLGSPG